MGSGVRLLLLLALASALGGTATRTALADGYSDAVAADNPLGWWRLDETSGSVAVNSGSTGSAVNGTYSNVTLNQVGVTQSGRAIRLNGSTSSVSFPGTQFNRTGPFSLEVWVNTVYASNPNQVVFRTAGTYGAMIYMHLSGAIGTVGFEICSHTAICPHVDSSYPINDGQWHQVVATYSGDATQTMRLYVDGQQVASTTYTASIYYVGSGAALGAWSSKAYFMGEIDEFSYYSTALDSSRVAAHYAASNLPSQTPPSDTYGAAVIADKPLTWWPLDEIDGASTAQNVAESGTQMEGTYSNVTLGTPGVVPNDRAATFDGASSNVDSPSFGFERSSPFSVEAWFKTSSTRVGTQYVYRTHSVYGAMILLGGGQGAANVGKVTFGFYDHAATFYGVTSSTTYNDGAWHHVVGTADGTNTAHLFIDGTEIGAVTYANPIYFSSTGAALGEWSNKDYFEGSIDDFAFYPVALGADRVEAHYDDRWGISGVDRQALLDAFRPEYRFSQTEPYRPASAALATDTFVPSSHTNTLLFEQSVIAASDPSQIIGTSDVLSLDYLATAPSGGIYPDNPRIDEGNVGGDQVDWSLNDYDYMLSQHPGQYNDIVYGRVVPDPQHSGQDILQYWVYYYYNQKTFYGAGEHEGDWELIQIHLDASGAPLSATYAQHGTPEKCVWSDVPISSGTHPIVWVADGSHASYFWPGNHSLPVWTEDTTGSLDSYYPEAPAVIDVTNPPSWLMWDGQWGGSGDSPPSPSVQSAWTPFTWEPASPNCTSPPAPSPSRVAGSATSGSVAAAPSSVIATTLVVAPALPRFRARRDGERVVVNYCFASMPSDARRRPWRIQLAVDNVSDSLPPATLSWAVKTRCGRIVDRVRYVKPSFVLRLSVRSRFGAESAIRTVKLK